MSVIAPYRVHQSTTTIGTVSYVLNPAILANNNIKTFYATGATVPYMVTDSVSNYEIGYGVLTTGSPDTLSRVTILLSSNSNSAVNWPNNTAKEVIVWEGAGTTYPTIITVSKVLDATDWGKTFVYTGSGATITVPALSTVPLGYSFDVINSGSGSLTLTLSGSDSYIGTGVSALAVGQRASFKAVPNTGWVQSSNTSIGSGTFTNLTVTTQLTGPIGTWTSDGLNSVTIGATTPSTGAFTTLRGSGYFSFGGPTMPVGQTILAGQFWTDLGTGIVLVAGKSISSANGVNFGLMKSRGSQASPSVVVTGDTIAALTGYGFDGTNYIGSAQITMVSSGTIGIAQIPGNMNFLTANSSGTLTINAQLNSAGLFSVSSGLANSLTLAGSATNPILGTNAGNIALNPNGTRVIINQQGNSSFGILTTQNASAGADLKNWDIGVVGVTNFGIYASNDAFSGITSAYVIGRGTTYNIASHTWYTSTVAGTAVQAMQITSGNITIGDGTNTAFQFARPNGSAWVNYLVTNGNTTGNSPLIGVSGSDTNISINISSKGTGGINFQTAGTARNQFTILDNASGVNYVTVTSGSTSGLISTNSGDLSITSASNNVILNKGQVATGYSKQTPTTGFAITIAAAIRDLILDPAGTLATGTITMPAAPVDGQIITVSSSQTITALTVSPNTGQSIKNAPTALTVSATGSYSYEFRYVLSNTTWYRIQ